MSYSSERSALEVTESGIDKNMLYQWPKRYTPDADKSEQTEEEENIRVLQCACRACREIKVPGP